MSQRRLKFSWFIIGTLFGAIATGALVVGLVGTQPFMHRAVPVEKKSAAAAVQKIDCPELSPANAPWQAAVGGAAARIEQLHVPRSLKKRVQFWKLVWGELPEHVYLMIDGRRPWVIHRKIDCRDLLDVANVTVESDRKCDRRLISAKRKLVRKLRRRRRRPPRALLKLFGNSRRLARGAYRNITVVEGRKESFERAHRRIEGYLADVESVFLSLGLLPSLARLAIIESLANPAAESPRGAVGAYQFVSGTARQYLTVNEDLDERLDPLREGWAAASYLKALYADFRSWPLALTAYNTGPARLKRVIRRRRTRDIGRLADSGAGNFGFDGQNYYAQLAAVIELIGAPQAGNPDGGWEYFRVEKPLSFSKVARCLAVAEQSLVESNPALMDPIVQGHKDIPPGYLIAVRQRDNETAPEPAVGAAAK